MVLHLCTVKHSSCKLCIDLWQTLKSLIHTDQTVCSCVASRTSGQPGRYMMWQSEKPPGYSKACFLLLSPMNFLAFTNWPSTVTRWDLHTVVVIYHGTTWPTHPAVCHYIGLDHRMQFLYVQLYACVFTVHSTYWTIFKMRLWVQTRDTRAVHCAPAGSLYPQTVCVSLLRRSVFCCVMSLHMWWWQIYE